MQPTLPLAALFLSLTQQTVDAARQEQRDGDKNQPQKQLIFIAVTLFLPRGVYGLLRKGEK
jgi:hypothetical protein